MSWRMGSVTESKAISVERSRRKPDRQSSIGFWVSRYGVSCWWTIHSTTLETTGSKDIGLNFFGSLTSPALCMYGHNHRLLPTCWYMATEYRGTLARNVRVAAVTGSDDFSSLTVIWSRPPALLAMLLTAFSRHWCWQWTTGRRRHQLMR